MPKPKPKEPKVKKGHPPIDLYTLRQKGEGPAIWVYIAAVSAAIVTLGLIFYLMLK